MNKKAMALLEQALSKPAGEIDVDKTFGSSAIMCGPYAWQMAGDSASFKGATPVTLMVNGAALQGRGISDKEQKRLLWRRLMEKLNVEGPATVRKANADEIRFFWAMIPFDIQEPLFVADYGRDKLLVNFVVKNDEPRLFWIDIVQDLKH